MEKLKFEIDINAPREKVWSSLWEDVNYRNWTSAFSEGSYAESDWKEGSKILFLGPGGRGMYSMIEKKTDNEFMSFKHLGEMKDFKELPNDDKSKSWSGSHENYTLKSTATGTHLTVELDSVEEFKDYFSGTFPKALQKVKEIAEK
jgi:uncharacterized protein YndB with AHSA1/START domain